METVMPVTSDPGLQVRFAELTETKVVLGAQVCLQKSPEAIKIEHFPPRFIPLWVIWKKIILFYERIRERVVYFHARMGLNLSKSNVVFV